MPGCPVIARSKWTLKPGYVCDRHWFKLPLPLRQRWWQVTNYGERRPTAELLAEVANHSGRQST